MRPDGALQLRLGDPTVEVAPGGEATVSVDVACGPDRAATVGLRVTGRAEPWVRADHGDVALAAGGAARVRLTVRPPATAPEGVVPFAVEAADDAGGRTRVTGLLVLTPPRGLDVQVVPATVAARRAARCTVTLGTGTGTGGTVDARVVALDVQASDGLQAALDQPTVQVGAASPAQVGLTLRPRRPALTARTRAAVVRWSVLPTGDPHGTARVEVVQRPLVHPAVAAAVAVLVLLAGVAGTRVLLGHDPLPWVADPPPPGQEAPVEGDYVQLWSGLKGADEQASRDAAQRRADELVAAGLDGARVVSGGALPDPAERGDDFWVVVRDGFDGPAAVARYCAEHADAAVAAGGRCVPGG
ncbi:COG1470 family protein [Thalassiella azotivora]